MAGTVSADALFLGLTRPPMLFGVSYKFAALNGLVSLLAFVITSDFVYLLFMLPATHTIAWFICLREPRAIELIIALYQKCRRCKNRYYFGGVNSYDVY